MENLRFKFRAYDKMKKAKIIVYHNIILDKNVYIVVFINQPLVLERAGNVLKTFSSLKYYAIPTGLNAVTFVERKENFDSLLPTTEEFRISKIMLMSLPDKKGKLRDKSFEDIMKMYSIKKSSKVNIYLG